MATDVLDLDDLTANAQVKINGELHPIRSYVQFSPMELHRLRRMSGTYDTLSPKDELTPQEEQELESLPDRMCRMVLLAPDEVHVKLQDYQRMAVVAAFFQQPRATKPSETSPVAEAETSRDGASSLPA